MDLRVKQILSDILDREGGYVNRAEDRGGPTNFGITLGVLSEFRGVPQTAEDVRTMTETEALMIYESRYISPFRGIEAYDLLDLLVDTAVNNGRRRASIWLQRVAGVVEDGEIGPVTLASVNSHSRQIYYKMCAIRTRAYGALISQKHSQAIFAAGWLNRIGAFIERDVSLM